MILTLGLVDDELGDHVPFFGLIIIHELVILLEGHLSASLALAFKKKGSSIASQSPSSHHLPKDVPILVGSAAPVAS